MTAPTSLKLPAGVVVKGALAERYDEVLSHDALAFVADLQRRFNETRKRLLAIRKERQKRFDKPAKPRISSPRPSTSAKATGRWRRSPPICSTAVSRSPARSTAR
jgi:malate synthase